MKPFLSLCMIVKNEELVLDNCLSSVHNLVDEYVIVDTGSSDATEEIILRYTDVVHSFDWTHDFAAARNYSIRHAHGKWILVLDADEYVDLNLAQEIRSFLLSLDYTLPTGIILPIINFVGVDNSGNVSQSKSLRLFSNHPDLSFIRPIHEQLVSHGASLKQVEYDFPIYHTGYTAETLEKKEKSARNLSIFKKIEETQSLTAYDCFTIGNEYYSLDQYEQALSCYLKALQNDDLHKSWMPQCLVNLISCLMKLERYAESYSFIRKAQGFWPAACDFYWLEGKLLATLYCDEKALSVLHTCLNLANHDDGCLVSPNYGSTLPLQLLATLHLRLFQVDEATKVLSQLLYVVPNHQPALFELLRILKYISGSAPIENLLASLYPNLTDDQLTMLFNLTAQLGLHDIAESYLKRLNDKPSAPKKETTLLSALLCNNWESYRSVLVSIDPDVVPSLLSLLLAGKYVWPEHAPCFSTLPALTAGENSVLVSALLVLYRQGKYEAYDYGMTTDAESSAIINLLGDHFFEERQFELAMDYYSHLLDNHLLSVKGYENIARLYIHQGEVAEGLRFLEESIRLSPDNMQLYLLYISHVQDPLKKNEMKKRFSVQFPNQLELLPSLSI